MKGIRESHKSSRELEEDMESKGEFCLFVLGEMNDYIERNGSREEEVDDSRESRDSMVMSLKKPQRTGYRACAHNMVLSYSDRILEGYAIL